MSEKEAHQRSPSRHRDMLDRVDYKLITTDEDKQEIYRLRYRAYLKEGAIAPNPLGITTDRFDDLPNTWIFGVYLDGELASSLRISVGSKEHPETPSMDVFPDLLKPEVDAGKVFVDPTRFVADPDRARRCPELPYMTVRLAYVACAYFEADIGLATVRAEHQAFYRRTFLQTSLCEPRMFPGLLKPVGIMAADFRETRDRVFARYPFMRSSHFEQRKLFQRHDPSFAEFDLGQASIVPRH